MKSVTLKGNLRSDDGTLKSVLSTINFKQNVWAICVKDIAYENKSNAAINSFAQITCNLVHDLRCKNSSTENFCPPIATILIKSVAKEKRITYLEKTWFQVNAPNDVLQLQLIDPETENLLSLNCDFFITVLLKTQ